MSEEDFFAEPAAEPDAGLVAEPPSEDDDEAAAVLLSPDPAGTEAASEERLSVR